MFSLPRQLEPLPTTTKTQGCLPIKTAYSLSMIVLISPLTPSTSFPSFPRLLLQSHSLWVWGWLSVTNIEAHSFFFFPLIFFVLSNLFFHRGSPRQSTCQRETMREVSLRENTGRCMDSNWPESCSRVWASQRRVWLVGVAYCAFCLVTEGFTAHRQNPLNWVHTKTFTLARIIIPTVDILNSHRILSNEIWMKHRINGPEDSSCCPKTLLLDFSWGG